MSLGQQLAPHLPFLRRFARALTGSQEHGDGFVKATLEQIVGAPSDFPMDADPKLGLYRTFLRAWSGSGVETAGEGNDEREITASARLSMIDKRSRQALLLADLEGFGLGAAAYILDTTSEEIAQLVDDAREEIEAQLATSVLIIEDEPIIAMDLEGIVRDLGHEITGIAVTRDEAVARASETTPGLVLADIQLADDSSGIDAVQDILEQIEVPVIFITAYPERLLTGERSEPAFLITKPFQHSTVKAAIAQALFFNRATAPA